MADQDDQDWAADDKLMSRGWTAVGILMPRGNKPLTLEFRQHQGTTDHIVISWWVKFLGTLIRYAAFLCRDMGYQLKDQGPLHPTEVEFLEHWGNSNSILDLLSFPREGKEHFQGLAELHKSHISDDKRAMERKVIQNRIARTKMGQYTGEEQDSHIRKLSWYKNTIIKNPWLDVLPQPKFRSRESWPDTPVGVGSYLVGEAAPDEGSSLLEEWLKDKKLFKKLLRVDGSGRIWLWKWIMDDQGKKGVVGRAERGEVVPPSDSDTEMEDA